MYKLEPWAEQAYCVMATDLRGPTPTAVLQQFFKMSEAMASFGEDVSETDQEDDEVSEDSDPEDGDPFDLDVVHVEPSSDSGGTDVPLSDDAQDANVAQQTAHGTDVTRRAIYEEIVTNVRLIQKSGRVQSVCFAALADELMSKFSDDRIRNAMHVDAVRHAPTKQKTRCVVTGRWATGCATLRTDTGGHMTVPIEHGSPALVTLGLAIMINNARRDPQWDVYRTHTAEEAARVIMHALTGLQLAFS